MWYSVLLFLWLFSVNVASAGCGCDKPPPPANTVIPSAAYEGLGITLFNSALVAGQTWTVRFGPAPGVKTQAVVVIDRDPSDPSGETSIAQLPVVVPAVAPGPTEIHVSRGSQQFNVNAADFTVVGHPVRVTASDGNYDQFPYTAGVSGRGELFFAVTGMRNSCGQVRFTAEIDNYPLRVTKALITSAGGQIVDAWPGSARFAFTPGSGSQSDKLVYTRSVFSQFCVDHQHGGVDEVDWLRPGWHLDGTQHTDYEVLIFGFEGKLNGTTDQTPGPVTLDRVRVSEEVLQ